MAAVAKPQQFFTLDEYFAFEEQSDHRSEYHRGEIFAMAGGSVNHNQIVGNLYAGLRGALGGKPCRVFMSDLRLLVANLGLYTYPDVMVICDRIEFAPKRKDTVTNPTILVEVLSPSTEAYDRGKKFEAYRALPSLREYVLVDQERVHVDYYRLLEQRQWALNELSDGNESLVLEAAGAVLSIASLYEQVAWES